MWYQLVFALIVMVVSYAIRPKPEGAKPATLTDVEAPTATTGVPIPVIFGTVRVTGPNCVWFGDLSTAGIKRGGK